MLTKSRIYSFFRLLAICLSILILLAGISYILEQNVLISYESGLYKNGRIYTQRNLRIEGGAWFIPEGVRDYVDFKLSLPSPLPGEENRYVKVFAVNDTLYLCGGEEKQVSE